VEPCEEFLRARLDFVKFKKATIFELPFDVLELIFRFGGYFLLPEGEKLEVSGFLEDKDRLTITVLKVGDISVLSPSIVQAIKPFVEKAVKEEIDMRFKEAKIVPENSNSWFLLEDIFRNGGEVLLSQITSLFGHTFEGTFRALSELVKEGMIDGKIKLTPEGENFYMEHAERKLFEKERKKKKEEKEEELIKYVERIIPDLELEDFVLEEFWEDSPGLYKFEGYFLLPDNKKLRIKGSFYKRKVYIDKIYFGRLCLNTYRFESLREIRELLKGVLSKELERTSKQSWAQRFYGK